MAQQWITVHAGCFELWVWGVILCRRGSNLGGWLTPFLYLGLFDLCSYIFPYGGACTEDRGSHMDRLLLDHFQWLMVILYSHMPAI